MTVLVATVLAAALPGESTPSPTSPTASSRPVAALDAAALRSKLAEDQDRITSVRVEYQSARTDVPRMEIQGAYAHRIVDAMSPGFFLHISAHGQSSLPWQDDPLQQHAYIQPYHVKNIFLLNRVYFEQDLDPGEGLPGTLKNEFFFLATGIWPLGGFAPPRPADRPYMLKEVAASKTYSLVRPEQETLDGRWCHVLERPGEDRLWIDVGRGCCLLARETHSAETGALVQRIELGGHREVAQGIWMPRWIRNIQYDFNAPTPEGRRRAWIDAVHDILQVEVNQSHRSSFEFQPPPGSLRTSPATSPVQTIPGGTDHLENLAHWLRRYSSAPPRAPAIDFGYLAGLPAAVLVVCLEMKRRFSRRFRHSNALAGGWRGYPR